MEKLYEVYFHRIRVLGGFIFIGLSLTGTERLPSIFPHSKHSPLAFHSESTYQFHLPLFSVVQWQCGGHHVNFQLIENITIVLGGRILPPHSGN